MKQNKMYKLEIVSFIIGIAVFMIVQYTCFGILYNNIKGETENFFKDTALSYAYAIRDAYNEAHDYSTVSKTAGALASNLNKSSSDYYKVSIYSSRNGNLQNLGGNVIFELDRQVISHIEKLMSSTVTDDGMHVFATDVGSLITESVYTMFNEQDGVLVIVGAERSEMYIKQGIGYSVLSTVNVIIVVLLFFTIYFLVIRKHFRRISENENQLEKILHGTGMPIYVVDPETHEVLFSNDEFKKIFGGVNVGGICYNSLFDRKEPCKNCFLSPENSENALSGGIRHDDKKHRRTFIKTARMINWVSGRQAILTVLQDETDFQNLKEENRIAKQKLNDFVDVTTDWIFELDGDFVISSYQNNSENDFFDSRAAVKMPFIDVLEQDDRERVLNLLVSTRENKSRLFKTAISYKSGLSCGITAVSYREDDVFMGYRIVANDITERINTNLALDRQLKQQELLSSILLNFSTGDNFENAIIESLSMFGKFSDVSHCGIFRYKKDTNAINCVFEWAQEGKKSLKEAFQNLHFKSANPFVRQLTEDSYVAINDLSVMQDILPTLYAQNIRAMLTCSIMIDNKLWGSLGIECDRGPREWTVNEVNLLKTIGGILSAVISKREAEKRNADTLAKLEGVVKDFPGIIWCLDNHFNTTLMAGTGMHLFGLSTESAVGANLLDIIKNYPELEINMRKTLEEGPQQFTLDAVGKTLNCYTNTLHNLYGNVSGLVGTAIDITEMIQLQKELESAMESAQRANQAKSEFLSRMSHEIRTPMNAIVGMTKIAMTSEVAKVPYCLEKIDTASKQLMALINDVLDMSKIEANKLEIFEDEFDFQKMLLNVYNVVTVKAEERKQNLAIQVDDSIPQYLISDELRLSQVLINLLSNAIKFTPEHTGRIVLKITGEQLTSNSLSLHIEVSDNGIGISEKNQEKLFTSFEQADGGIARKYGGTGLGLAICKKILNLMGSDIKVQSADGQGSTFSFDLAVQIGRLTGNKKPVVSINNTEIKMLVIDDASDVLEHFTRIVKNLNIVCDTASGGLEAIAMVKEAIAAGSPYNMIFVDWKMPGLNGVETAQAIKEIEAKSGLGDQKSIVIMMSITEWREIASSASVIGIDKYIPKPILPSSLFNIILETTGNYALKQNKGADGISWEDKHLLVVEDIDINREIVATLVEPTGISIDFAEDGKKGVEAFRNNPDKYDAILMDIHMPEMDGYEATVTIRNSAHPRAKTVPIIAMTANAFQEDIEKCMASGMNEHVAKPVDLEILLDKLKKHIQNTETERNE